MRVWIDILTPKQVLFLGEVADRLRDKGIELSITLRRFRETIGLARSRLKRHIPVVVGGYGGGLLIDKLRMSLERAQQLVPYVDRFSPDITLSFSSPEAARVSFGLGVPHYSANDIPEADAVARLTIPLSKKLFTPWIIPKKVWIRYGIDEDNIVYYKGLDPVAWLSNYNFDPEVPSRLGLRKDGYMVIRAVESKVSYQLPILRRRKILDKDWIPKLANEYRDYDIVIIGRYLDQIRGLIEAMGNNDNIIIPTDVVDGPSLIRYSSMFIGYGGTMTVESALLGVPTISLRPGKTTHYLKFLYKLGLIRHLNNENEVLAAVTELIDKGEEIKNAAENLLVEMENPVDVIVDNILASQ